MCSRSGRRVDLQLYDCAVSFFDHVEAWQVADFKDGETGGTGSCGGLSAFWVDPSGELALMNSTDSGGKDPCFVTSMVDRERKENHFVLCANYSGGRCDACLLCFFEWAGLERRDV